MYIKMFKYLKLLTLCACLAVVANSLRDTDIRQVYSVDNVVTQPGGNQTVRGWLYLPNEGYDDMISLIGQYNEINNGTTITRALIMLSRIMVEGMSFDYPQAGG